MRLFKILLRLFYTIKYIKAIQLYYQVWYRIKRNVINIHWYKKYQNTDIVFFNTETDRLLFVPESACIDGLSFKFIGLTHQFIKKVDWKFAEHGKLWNYNLQYQQYLLDERLSEGQRTDLLKDISRALLSGELPLEPYPVSIRIVNTFLFLQRTRIRDTEIEQALLFQIDYLDNNLEYHLLANHLLENFFALFIAALYLNNKQLTIKYEKRLSEQLKEQILADGGHYECTPMYQSILLAKLLICIEIAMQSDLVQPSFIVELKNYASRMLGWMQTYSFPDGSWALFNDAAEEIAPTTSQLRTTAGLLKLPICKIVLKESGFSKLGNENWELIVKTGKIQPGYQPGHVHSDIGSFCLWYQGIQYIVDPGISTYAVSRQRTRERSTPAHNTIAIDDLNQSDVWGGFRVGKRALVKEKECSENTIKVEIVGYGGKNINIERLFVYKNDELKVADSIKLNKREYWINTTGRILFNSQITVVKVSQTQISANQLTIQFENDNFDILDAEAASRYNQLVKTKRVVYKTERKGSITIKLG